jgi:hypothetical protein
LWLTHALPHYGTDPLPLRTEDAQS